ncbi:S9 family peptidase [Oerskovia flava]|uniref:S9 family peptidase n=1 Tax=Oerskovia flava TaxID=2986422 RepID=UPI00224000A9|nr:prolyl oligopeptidase family serine peptidase [Oerskovia sp. JB1-3-2]
MTSTTNLPTSTAAVRAFEPFVPQRRFADAVALHPDGGTVAYVSNDAGAYDLVLRPVAGGEPRRLTRFDDRSVRSIAWSPDGNRIAFTADRDGDEQTQVYLVDVDLDAAVDVEPATEPVRLTPADDRQYQLAAQPFLPDGSAIVYTGNDRDPSAHDVLVHPLGPDGPAAAPARRIEVEPGMTMLGAVSPDGRYVLVRVLSTTSDSDVAVVDLQASSPALEILTGHDGVAQHVPGPWLPDGSGFLVRTDRGADFTALASCALDGTLTVLHAPEADVESVQATPGGTFTWVVNEPTGAAPYVLDPTSSGTPSGDPRRVPLPSGVLDEPCLLPDGSALVGLFGTGVRPRELVVVDLATGEVRYLTESRPAAIREGAPVAPELVSYPTHDGRQVPAWLYRPHPRPGADDARFPVVLSVHGGPESQERAEYNYAGLYQYLLAQGVGVLAPNVRGSTGYGAAYQRLIQRDWGGAELGDLEHAVRYLHGLDWVDPARVGVFGGSFGGFAALSCLSRLPDLFAVGVSVVGPSNLVTLGRSVPESWRPIIAAWLGDPDDDHDFLMSRSPVTYADQIVAPLYVVQGAKDPRVVQAESDQIVEALRARGVEVRYDVFPDEGHGFTKRANEIRAIGDIAEFLVTRLT